MLLVLLCLAPLGYSTNNNKRRHTSSHTEDTEVRGIPLSSVRCNSEAPGCSASPAIASRPCPPPSSASASRRQSASCSQSSSFLSLHFTTLAISKLPSAPSGSSGTSFSRFNFVKAATLLLIHLAGMALAVLHPSKLARAPFNFFLSGCSCTALEVSVLLALFT